MTISHIRIGHNPMQGSYKNLGESYPNPRQTPEKSIFIKKVSLKNLKIKATVPMLFSSIKADGI
jgi:hypothetical protein